MLVHLTQLRMPTILHNSAAPKDRVLHWNKGLLWEVHSQRVLRKIYNVIIVNHQSIRLNMDRHEVFLTINKQTITNWLLRVLILQWTKEKALILAWEATMLKVEGLIKPLRAQTVIMWYPKNSSIEIQFYYWILKTRMNKPKAIARKSMKISFTKHMIQSPTRKFSARRWI